MTRKLLLILTLAAACKPTQHPSVKPTGLVANKTMVVSARIEASEIGVEIMRKGGNAFDAMAATELALAVAYPYAGNIGGGGFMVYRTADGKTGSLDYREKAPMAAHEKMYQDANGNVIQGRSIKGATASGIPGTIAGIFAVHEKFGSLPIGDIMEPAIRLAEHGVVVTEKQQAQMDKYRNAIVEVSGPNTLLAHPYKAGDTIRYLAFAKTLRRIQKNGRPEFYKGETAQKLVEFLSKNGGIITLDDLAGYEAKWRDPIVFDYKGLKVISMAPPSSGGICLAQIIKMIEPYDISGMGHNSAKAIRLITEAERRAYADRNHFLGDPDFVDIPVKKLLDSKYLKKRMGTFSFEKATPSATVSHGSLQFPESMETTHYSIVDQFGNAVSATTTINDAFGSKLYCDELGFFLNNEMDDFSAKPGTPNMFGLIGAKANSIAPGKRMLSSMTPTIVEKNGELFMVVGTPGGSTIITSVLQTILNVYEFGMSMQDAVNAARFHHQWLPDEVVFDPNGFSPELLDELRKKGYKINEKTTPVIGKVDAILILPDGKMEGGADHRGDDKAAGF
ncbi:gamma-glutamyltransferase [Flavobacterium sp.]|uniref:gamma-glutamyltransferase n=1 Tax=Flavobacterium sp. TaxID=239 RepID=UPI0040337036